MAINYKSPLGGNAPKIRPFLALLFTTLISALLIWQREVRSTGTFHDAVTSNPGTASFFKQIIAGLLGAIWVYVAGSLFNLTTRLRLASTERTPSLQAVNVWAAVGCQRVDFSLPVQYLTLTLAVALAGHAIGSVWGGAITPISSPATFFGQDRLRVPLFSAPWFTSQFPDDGDAGSFDDNTGVCETYNGPYGLIPSCPVPGLQNLILESATTATTFNGLPRNHSKNDNPEWSYVGRSYGVGSSQGIAPYILNIDVSNESLQTYSYSETGYLVDSQCSFNTNSVFTLSQVVSGYQPANGSNVLLDIFVANGTLPNADDSGDIITYPLVLTNQTLTQNNPDQSNSSGLLTWAASSKNISNVISIAAFGAFEAYSNMMCNVSFSQEDFDVAVDFSRFTISVTPLGQTSQDISFDTNNYLESNAMASLSLLAQTAASIVFETLGESLNTNWQTFNQTILYGSSGTLDITYNTTQEFQGNGTSILLAAEDSFNAMLDDILVGYGAAQLFWKVIAANDTSVSKLTPVNSTYSATRLGQDGYIFATLAVNLVLIIIGVEEAIRTRNWEKIPLLDYLDLKSVIVATSAGGKGIWEDCHSRHVEGEKWNGRNSSKEAAAVRVRLGQGSNNSPDGPVIVLAQEGIADGK